MSNLKDQDGKYAAGNARTFKGWRLLVGLMIVALLAVAPTLLGLADAGGEKGHSFEVSFTKWVTSPPDMIGVVGGDVGPGTFAGQIVSMDAGEDFTTIVAVYHINGSEHSFSADIKAVQNNKAGTGVITGEITEGWLKGRDLAGAYKVLAECNMETDPNAYGKMCFQGTLSVPAVP